MRQSTVSVRSAWGVELRNACAAFDPAPPVGVVLFPGDSYRCDAPLLYFARLVALQRGADVLSLEYGYQVARVPLGGLAERVVEEAAAAVARFVRPGHRRLVFVSKSLGTRVAGRVAAGAGLPVSHVLLTPVPGAVPLIGPAGATVLVGTADPVFDAGQVAGLAGRPGVDLHLVEGADHALTVPGDHARSLAILGDVCATLDAFMARACSGG